MTVGATGTRVAAAARGGSSTGRYRPELQGLRALAAALVVIYHVWFGRVSGGVDVFFLISGFLITSQLFRAGERGGIRYRALWGRMIKRLFPAALTVLVVTIGAGVLLLPESRWFQTVYEVVASALYVENWQLAADSVNYFAQHQTASVAQHFWSLSIQGQFYLVWPLLVALTGVLARAAGARLRPVLCCVLLLVLIASLAYSIVLTAANQPLAYFHSLTRVWEFAFGGLLALTIDAMSLHRAGSVLLGWLGVLGLVSCGLLLRVGISFPGYLALWPTICAVLVIFAGGSGSRFGADRLLASKPLEYLGDLSYSLYLWHWPVLLFYLVATRRADPGFVGGIEVIALAVLLAMLTYHLVERPVRGSGIGERSRWGSYRFGALLLVPVLLLAGGWHALGSVWAASSAVTAAESVSGTNVDHPGARAREPGFRFTGDPGTPPAPAFVALPEDWASIEDARCRYSPRDEELQICASRTARPPARRLVVIGNSHMQQYIAALEPVAAQRNWQLITMLEEACPFTAETDTDARYRSCVDWNAAAAEEIRALRPDAVLTLATKDVRAGLSEHTPRGYVAQWRNMDEAGIPVLAIRDNPRYDFAPSKCVAAYGMDAPRCGTPRAEIIKPTPPYADLPGVPPNVRFLDFTDYFCEPERCPPVVGNVLVYLDDNHVTATFMTTLAPILGRGIVRALGW